MKRLLLLITILITMTAEGQTRDSLYFYQSESGKLQASRRLKTLNADGEVNLSLYGRASEDGSEFRGVYLKVLELGKCNGDNRLVLLFMRGERVVLDSSSPFNCKGLAFFPVSEDEGCYLQNYRLWSVRFINGRNRNYYDRIKTGMVQPKDWAYFQEFYYAVQNKLFSNYD